MGLFAGTPFDRPLRCERCEQLEAECQCLPETPLRTPPEKQILRVAVEKRKKGKTVTVIRDLAPEPEVLAELVTQLKTQCGAGGSLQENLIEIQGDHLQRIQTLLTKLGYRIKK